MFGSGGLRSFVVFLFGRFGLMAMAIRSDTVPMVEVRYDPRLLSSRNRFLRPHRITPPLHLAIIGL